MTAAVVVLVLGALAWVWGRWCGRDAVHPATVAALRRLARPAPATGVGLAVGHGIAAALALGLAAVPRAGQGDPALPAAVVTEAVPVALAPASAVAMMVALAVRVARRRAPDATATTAPGLVLGLVAQVRCRGGRPGPALGWRQVVAVGVVLGSPAAAPVLAAALVLPALPGVHAGAAGGTAGALAVVGACGALGTASSTYGPGGRRSGAARTSRRSTRAPQAVPPA